MVRHASLFSKIVGFFDRNKFAKLVSQHEAEKSVKKFRSWDHFVSMMFCQLAQAKSLREIVRGLATCNGKLKHLGMKEAPNKSTLSYANQKRPWEMYQSLFYQTLETCRLSAPMKHRFGFKNKLLSLDSSTISLCLSMFPWTKYRRTKGAVKLHLLLDHDGYLPSFVHITTGGKHDITIARQLSIAPGSIVAMDRAYRDYKLFSHWTDDGVYFVTRTKKNAAYRVVEQRPVPQNRNIMSDEIIEFTAKVSFEKCPHRLRRIVVFDKENDRYIDLLTNHMEFGATTIAAIYKDRWQIEPFLKPIKQNLRIKTFVGTSENALMIQISTALIAMLVIKFLQSNQNLGGLFQIWLHF